MPAGVVLVVTMPTQLVSAAFSALTGNSGSSLTAGTVSMASNASGSSLFTFSGATPGASQSRCVKVTYTGSLDARVRLYGGLSGSTGLDPYVQLRIARGTQAGSPSSGDCTGFTPDSRRYRGADRPAGTFVDRVASSLPTSFASGLRDPDASGTETWSTNEAHAYQITLTLAPDAPTAAQSKTVTLALSWEARDLGNESSPTTDYRTAVLADSPLSYWRLDEAEIPTALDQGTNGRNGTYAGTPGLNASGATADGDTAFTSSAGRRAELGDVADFSGRAPFTVELWFRPNGYGGTYPVLLSKADPGNTGGWLVYANPAGTITVSRSDGAASDDASTSNTASLNTWHHIVATYDGTSLQATLDTTAGSAISSTRSIPDHTGLLTAGDYGPGMAAYPFDGTIDEVAVYGTALSATRIKAHYDAR